jgi:tRNA(Arg) A34 adenosine deaminase TadA
VRPGDIAALRRAIELSRISGQRGDEPYGAVLADADGRVVAEAQNTQHTLADVTGHAELNLVRQASRRLGREALARYTAYASGEPCPMCAGALFWSGVRRVVFALDVATMQRLAGEGAEELLISCREIFERGTRPMEVIGPALAIEAGEVLKAYYGSRSRLG